MRPVLLAMALLAVTLAGCVDSEPQPEALVDASAGTVLGLFDQYIADLQADPESAVMPVVPDPATESEPRSVVAVIDTGVNAFHEFFQRPETLGPGSVPVAAVDELTGKSSQYVPVRPLDDYERGETWLDTAVEGQTLYRFAGTNLFYYSVLEDVTELDYNGHGTATAATVIQNAPDVAVVMVQTDGANLTAAMEWAASQSWIDVLSVSWGCLTNCVAFYPTSAVTGSESARVTKLSWDAGQLYVNSAGNDPTSHIFDGQDGPPWVIAAGGADPYRKGEAFMASKQPDVLANFTVIAPAVDSLDETRSISGTSFAAPTVAGALGQAVYELRAATGHLGGIRDGALVVDEDRSFTNADVGHAMNMAAVYWGPTDYDALAEHPAGVTSAGVPINPAAPWLQMGWGFVDAAIVSTMTDGLLNDSLPAKDAAAVAYMDGVMEARALLWS